MLITCHIHKYEYIKICCCHICDTYVGNANLLKGGLKKGDISRP